MTLRAGKRWTEARYRTFIRSALRSSFRKWPPKFDVLRNSQTEKRTNSATGRIAMHYMCAVCKKDFPAKQVQVDHIKPVVDLKAGFVSWDEFINRLLCEAKGLQVLCKPCHNVKSGKERGKRARLK